MLEGHSEVDRTHWDNTQDNLTDSRIRESFPYTWYALYHYLAFHGLSDGKCPHPKDWVKRF